MAVCRAEWAEWICKFADSSMPGRSGIAVRPSLACARQFHSDEVFSTSEGPECERYDPGL